MIVHETPLEGVLIIEPAVHKDPRGFFLETFSAARYEKSGVPGPFVQDNHSRSLKGTVRGLHFQSPPFAQTKLVRCIKGSLYDVILGPVITEKATHASEYNKVLFKVRGDATKPQIKEAVEKLFDVKVKSVNTLVRKGKSKMFRGNFGSQSDVKRAIVTLEEGHRIDVATGL